MTTEQEIRKLKRKEPQCDDPSFPLALFVHSAPRARLAVSEMCRPPFISSLPCSSSLPRLSTSTRLSQQVVDRGAPWHTNIHRLDDFPLGSNFISSHCFSSHVFLACSLSVKGRINCSSIICRYNTTVCKLPPLSPAMEINSGRTELFWSAQMTAALGLSPFVKFPVRRGSCF